MGTNQKQGPRFAEIEEPREQRKKVTKGLTQNEIAIAALNEEARRRRLSYGKLVGLLGPEEKAEIIRRYREKETAAG